ncbi:hypothetical protein SPOG_04762 [Schizosaccharomyces cryophilus OY26]|uniref:Uncharacterized protein n=1 Tax=Schizosaccharomyces cryophilus (strain OY26 / ATCC MYA-4695 / CBS 11777 / NBRC 106824 / NRRL Y48691) TaxID=653667 RepID=S9W245_SCHCR|nr:uncharacterized protein SPOG_04762 [Schizosaccharomyces cryophilus OY26]EPY52105.1 hypothetical protein SPOG_04762 [Schizosaccharomyces cryophilus OY26]
MSVGLLMFRVYEFIMNIDLNSQGRFHVLSTPSSSSSKYLVNNVCIFFFFLILSAICIGFAQAQADNVISWYEDIGSNTTASVIKRCITLNTDDKAVIQRNTVRTDGDFTVWLDAGNNFSHELNTSLTDRIKDCVSRSRTNTTTTIRSHNDYAVSGPRNCHSDVEEFYDFFGLEYPQDYDPGWTSEEYGSEDQDDVVLSKRVVDKPDWRSETPRYRSSLNVAWFAAITLQYWSGSSKN